jgi:hypothetical protein
MSYPYFQSFHRLDDTFHLIDKSYDVEAEWLDISLSFIRAQGQNKGEEYHCQIISSCEGSQRER